jgi:hypothetical protein
VNFGETPECVLRLIGFLRRSFWEPLRGAAVLSVLPVPETSSSEVLSTLSGVLGAVGLVTGQPTAVGGNKGIDELLQLPDAR